MSLKLNVGVKVFLIIIFLAASIYGFMIKLPGQFRHIDKELHSLYYFLAAAFLNILFTNGRFWVHALIFGLLFCFGAAIEYAQEYSNKLFHSRIHGRYDPEDIKYDLRGLLAYSAIWIVYRLGVLAYKKISLSRKLDDRVKGIKPE